MQKYYSMLDKASGLSPPNLITDIAQDQSQTQNGLSAWNPQNTAQTIRKVTVRVWVTLK
jgi:hypothetical protein